jgi:hypothetical protein
MLLKYRPIDEVKKFNTEYCLKLKQYKTTELGQNCLKLGSY